MKYLLGLLFISFFGGSVMAQTISYTQLYIPTQSTYTDSIKQYEKFEYLIPLHDSIRNAISLFINDSMAHTPDYVLSNYSGINPYNPNDIDVSVRFVHESGQEIIRYGFYYQQFEYSSDTSYWVPKDSATFLVRFSTNITGNWNAHVRVESEKYGLIYTYKPIEFTCTPDSLARGYLQKTKNNRYFEYSHTNKTFVMHGLNIPHPKVVPPNSPLFKKYSVLHFKEYAAYFEKAAKARCNFIRVALIGSYTSAPEFDVLSNFTNRQAFMQEFDSIIEFAETHGMYLEIIGDSFGPYLMGWQFNPYKHISDVSTPLDVFNSAEARMYYKHRIRYIFSRWGYSPAFSTYQIINEIDQISYNSEKLLRTTIFSWTSEMADYITNTLQYPIMLTSNYAGFDMKPYVFALDNIDVVTIHYYGNFRNHDILNLYGRVKTDWKTFNKPIIIDETGGHHSYGTYDKISPLLYKNRLFSTTFSGGAGSAIQYYWDVYLPKNAPVEQTCIWYHSYLDEFISILDSLTITNFNTLQFEPQRYPEYTNKNMYNFKEYDLEHSLIEQFALIDSSKNTIIGWTHNRSQYWANHTGDSTVWPSDDDIPTKPIAIDWKNTNNSLHTFVTFTQLPPNATYKITWYSTKENQKNMEKMKNCINSFTTDENGNSEQIFPPFSDIEFDFLFIAQKNK
ncbi:MAG: hypothetical protein BWY22_02082 [Bacteroidetes bacterium ADurb.Bin217]|nr:MAG: hypothetical protein BWY22_02082 [Bacteroidetes bacterium ADurb.Bin217]